jgi:VWFA-related protein
MRKLCLFVLCAASAVFGQNEEPITFRTSVSLVKVDAKVTTRDGRSINDLTKDDFAVFDEEASRPIVDFGSESQVEPLRLLLLLDVSGSMSRTLGDMSAKASDALRQLKAGDQVGVMAFATKSDVVVPFTTELKSVPEQIVKSVFHGTRGRETYLNEALLAATGYLNDQPSAGRRAILVVTDNEGARATTTDSDVLRALHGGNVVLNAILVGGAKKARAASGPYANPGSAPPDIFKFVQNTGGDVIVEEDASVALGRIVRQIATRYNFQYSPPEASGGTFRRIRVELSPAAQRRYPGAVVQARTGYYVEK